MSDSISTRPEGLNGGYMGHNITIQILLAVFGSLALYNAMELIILIFLTFHHYKGLYFWTMLLSSVLGVIPHALGFLFEFFAIGPIAVGVSISTVGFYFMVPGQSFVLYSRLHIVVQNRKLLRRILYFLIFTTIVMCVPTTVFTFTTIYVGTEPIIRGYNVMERIQVTWFAAQETFLSGIYIWETVKLLRLRPEKGVGRNRIMYELIAINIVMVGLDIVILVLEYLGIYILQTTLKAAIYSIKLKLEFAVLRKLVSLFNFHTSDSSLNALDEYPAFVDPTQISGDIRHVAPRTERLPSRAPWGAMSLESLATFERNDQSISSQSPRSS